MNGDKYILHLCKQQSFKNKETEERNTTANSTPEKPEQGPQIKDALEIEDLDNILEDDRYMKKNSLQVEGQRSNLMPKRIMSSKTKSIKKVEEAPKAPVKKAPKDRSALIGLKRTRKSRDQIYQLQKVYEDADGKPTKAALKQLAKDTGLKLQQVYKWYWDTEKKNDKLQKELTDQDPTVTSPLRLSRKILKTQYTDEFGGYSKTWFSDGIQEVKNQKGEEIQENFEDQGMDGLARSLGLDIEAIALELALNDGTPPTQCLPVQVDDETMEEACIKKESLDNKAGVKDFAQDTQLDKVRNILMKAKSTQYSPVIKTKGTQCSPIITPKVIRPNCPNTKYISSAEAASNASVSNVSSVISKLSKA